MKKILIGNVFFRMMILLNGASSGSCVVVDCVSLALLGNPRIPPELTLRMMTDKISKPSKEGLWLSVVIVKICVISFYLRLLSLCAKRE